MTYKFAICAAFIAGGWGGSALAQEDDFQPTVKEASDSVSVTNIDAPSYFERDTGDNLGNHTAEQVLDMSGFRIINAAEPSDPQDVTTKAYVDGLAFEGSSGGNGDNLGNHRATKDLDMEFYSILDLNDLDMQWNTIGRAELRNDRMYDSTIEGTTFMDGVLQTSTGTALSIDDSEMENSWIGYSQIDYPNINYMTANEYTVFNGFTVWNNDIWMKGHYIKEAKIMHSLDINGMPLINVPDPVDPADAANMQWVQAQIAASGTGSSDEGMATLQARMDDLEAQFSGYVTSDDARHDDLSGRVQANEDAIAELQAGSSDTGGSSGTVDQDIADLQAAVSQIESDFSTYASADDSRYYDLADRMNDAEAAIAAGSGGSSGTDYGDEISQLQSDFASYSDLDNARHYEVLGQISDLEDMANQLGLRLSALEDRVSALE